MDQPRAALSGLRKAADVFRDLGDLERTKVINLEVRLLEAMRSDAEADELRKRLERTLAASGLLTPESRDFASTRR